jgi:polyphenol oxidase
VEWRERSGARWLEAELPGAAAAFSTRVGGVSRPPYDALNVAVLTGDDREAVRANRLALTEALGRDPGGVVMARQVHGAELREHRVAQEPRVYADVAASPEEADGHTTGNPDLTPLVMVADCLPVAMVGTRGVAMAHCGWRGLAAGIVAEAAEAVEATAAAVGPGIGPCCYEVGDEVLGEFDDLDGVADGRMLDLAAVARGYSHRRDGERTGRQAGLVWVT